MFSLLKHSSLLLLVGVCFFVIQTSCSPAKKISGSWHWKSYDFNPHSLAIVRPDEREEFYKIVSDDFIKSNIENTRLEFLSDSIYNRYNGTTKKSGRYKLQGKDKVYVSSGILKSKTDALYTIIKLSRDTLVLEDETMTYVLVRKAPVNRDQNMKHGTDQSK